MGSGGGCSTTRPGTGSASTGVANASCTGPRVKVSTPASVAALRSACWAATGLQAVAQTAPQRPASANSRIEGDISRSFLSLASPASTTVTMPRSTTRSKARASARAPAKGGCARATRKRGAAARCETCQRHQDAGAMRNRIVSGRDRVCGVERFTFAPDRASQLSLVLRLWHVFGALGLPRALPVSRSFL